MKRVCVCEHLFCFPSYSTVYTMAPVLSLVLDEDVSADVALMYPELYQELMKGRSLTFKTFFIWVLISIYQGDSFLLRYIMQLLVST